MVSVKNKISAGLDRVRGGREPAVPPGDDVLRARVDALESRVNELGAELQEARRLNLRLAELTDIVQELLLPVEARDETKVREVLARYTDALG